MANDSYPIDPKRTRAAATGDYMTPKERHVSPRVKASGDYHDPADASANAGMKAPAGSRGRIAPVQGTKARMTPEHMGPDTAPNAAPRKPRAEHNGRMTPEHGGPTRIK